ncbi:hypothetical protein J6590_102230 [Homalodisca vitripennis]|nr:hypothetical protein J6590_102230 [Homalodisca vitripennis]
MSKIPPPRDEAVPAKDKARKRRPKNNLPAEGLTNFMVVVRHGLPPAYQATTPQTQRDRVPKRRKAQVTPRRRNNSTKKSKILTFNSEKEKHHQPRKQIAPRQKPGPHTWILQLQNAPENLHKRLGVCNSKNIIFTKNHQDMFRPGNIVFLPGKWAKLRFSALLQANMNLDRPESDRVRSRSNPC